MGSCFMLFSSAYLHAVLLRGVWMVRFWQPKKACLPMNTDLDRIVTFVSDLQCSNAKKPIPVTWAGTLMVVNDLQYAKA